MRFLDVAETADAVASARGTNAKRDLVAALLARADDASLPHAARFLSGTAFARADPRVLQVGWASLRASALALLPVDELTWSACHQATGDTGETLHLLMEAYPPERQAAQRTLFDHAAVGEPLTVTDVADLLAQLVVASAGAKPTLLERAWRRMSPLEARYFTKVITGGMRIGLSESLVEDAVARAFGREPASVRMSNMLSGDIGETAALARTDRLGETPFRLFHPLGFMLASPSEEPPDDVQAYLVEDKLDGIRAQLHVADGRAELFSRTLEAAREFPEIVESARRLPHELVLDGEVLAVRADGSPAPFAMLQRRLGRKSVGETLRRQVPVRFVAYDVLFIDGEPLWRKPLEERRAVLDGLALGGALGVSPLLSAATPEEARRLFEEARARGNEGLMFKRRGSTYDFGKRGQAWLKLKRAFATLDVVVTAAEVGHGKRAGLLSDVTFAVRSDDGALVNVGKAYTGLTDQEIAQMTSILKSITIERYGGNVHFVRPQIVLEVAFDSVTRSTRHKSGFALRFPRIVRWRHDKRPEDADTVARVRELWVASGGAETIGSQA